MVVNLTQKHMTIMWAMLCVVNTNGSHALYEKHHLLVTNPVFKMNLSCQKNGKSGNTGEKNLKNLETQKTIMKAQ